MHETDGRYVTSTVSAATTPNRSEVPERGKELASPVEKEGVAIPRKPVAVHELA